METTFTHNKKMDNPQIPALQKGMTFGYNARNGYYATPQARLEVDRMASLGIEWVCLVAIVMQETYASTRQYRDFTMTPADDELRDIIDYIHSRGMKVQLRPMLECFDGTQRLHVVFPGDFMIFPERPVRHATHWFQSMTERTLHYARLATRAGCEAFGIDSEIDQITHFNTEWKQVVAAARSVFSGHLTSSHTDRVDFLKDLQRPDHWFRDLDSIGTSFYHPVADKPGTSLDEMVVNLQPQLERYRRIAALYGKPVYFGECGCCSTAGATRSPCNWDNPGGYDGDEQARFLEAVLATFWHEPWWLGLYWWKWDEQNDRPHFRDDPRGDKGFTLWGKPAADTLQRWYARKDR